ncbi:cell division protein FtsH [Roseiconus nitratireducens]|uniref:Cell division protein FtsH n=1 Tax=Roseiconus nitratireducens TaxID=2605748 RepID=A0A5M6CZ20_9BACT|nr:cell division protein FtsH [Roseiconus nitratireducens]KAA5540478.1 cell division protein FtsH [Roseiconus nitratireducens]
MMTIDDDETYTAYHEAGHAVIGYALGGHIESVGMYAEADEWLPERFGDCHVNWGPMDPHVDWQRQREILTILAGPVAEMIYRSEKLHPAGFPPWQHDWHWAWQRSATWAPQPGPRRVLLESLIVWLHAHLSRDDCWAAVAAVADELLAHEYLDSDQLADTLAFWIRDRV